MKTLFNICTICIFSACMSFAQSANWISSTEKNKWKVQEQVKLNDIKHDVVIDVEIHSDQKQQTMEGWGGCFNELGWDALQTLNAKERETVFKSLFSTGDGLNFTICRMPIGANDYSRNWYSLDDSVGDFDMKHFSIKRDQGILIPYIKEAMKYQPALKLWASPWSPPAWMKTNKHYANKPGDHNDLKPENAVLSGNQFIQEEKYLSSYAVYLTKFVKAYKNEGINVFAVHFQNEPYTLNQWPNCSWTPSAMRDFIAKYLGPTFKKENLNTELWLGTWNTDKMANFDTVFSSPEAMKYIAGAGLQWEGKNIIKDLHKKYPHVKLMQTESECGGGDFSWKDAEHLFDIMKTYISGGASVYTYWNMVLADKGTSSWGWNQNALVRIDKTTQKVTYTPEYYIFKHFSYFVTVGSSKVESTGSYNNVVAFVNPKGEVVVVTNNLQDIPKALNIKIGNKYFAVTLQPNSFNTFAVKL